jgi:hypothetical protein
MYRIYQKDLYDHYPKAHFASTEEIAKEIYSDLEVRFGGIVMEPEQENKCMWDPGGIMMMNDEVFEFKLENTTVLCKAQHFEYFVDAIDKYAKEANIRGDKAKYIKLHGAYSCICITPFEFGQLKAFVQDSDYAERAEKSFAERERRLNELQNKGCLVRVVKDDEGNLYKLPDAADKKDLN